MLIGVLSAPSMFFNPTWGLMQMIGISRSRQTWLSRRGCRRETALPPALYVHLGQRHFTPFYFQHCQVAPLRVADRVVAVDDTLPLLVQAGEDVRDVVREEPDHLIDWVVRGVGGLSVKLFLQSFSNLLP